MGANTALRVNDTFFSLDKMSHLLQGYGSVPLV